MAIDLIGVPVYAALEDAEHLSKALGFAVTKSDPKKQAAWWVRVEATDFWRHYQFGDGALFLVTLSLPVS